jgi:arylsulfatase A-like enzyme
LHFTVEFTAAGPGIKRNTASPIPSANTDLTPTALALLGLSVPDGLDGRVLEEALASGRQPGEMPLSTFPVVTSVELDGLTYQMTVYRTVVDSTIYFDGTEVTRTRAGR